VNMKKTCAAIDNLPTRSWMPASLNTDIPRLCCGHGKLGHPRTAEGLVEGGRVGARCCCRIADALSHRPRHGTSRFGFDVRGRVRGGQLDKAEFPLRQDRAARSMRRRIGGAAAFAASRVTFTIWHLLRAPQKPDRRAWSDIGRFDRSRHRPGIASFRPSAPPSSRLRFATPGATEPIPNMLGET